ncbi:ROK family protein [Lacticaseibacillus absianus]|uniref:ROK family protein n=1 Tax=Lacticaseibacillus absianus TaxID=2729623 RepID=UPI0015C8B452|nr:ROK family protein [Lacticaseibacillus absianus]
MALLALDIGGTTIKHALFTEAGERITAVQETPTERRLRTITLPPKPGPFTRRTTTLVSPVSPSSVRA